MPPVAIVVAVERGRAGTVRPWVWGILALACGTALAGLALLLEGDRDRLGRSQAESELHDRHERDREPARKSLRRKRLHRSSGTA